MGDIIHFLLAFIFLFFFTANGSIYVSLYVKYMILWFYVNISVHAPNKSPCLEHLLGQKITPDLKWNSCICTVAKEAEKNGWFIVSRQKITNTRWPASV